MDERMKILQMLEDGKITADEAAKLLETILIHGPTPHRKHGMGVDSEIVTGVMGGVSDVIESLPGIIKCYTRLGTKGGKKTLTVKKKPTVRLSLVGGDLALSPSEDDIIRGNLSSGIVTAKDVRDGLLIKCMGGDANVQIPQVETLSISLVGGDLKGDLDAENLTVKTLDGDIDVSLKTLKNATFKSKSGDISLTIPENADAEVDAYTMSGELNFGPKIEVEEQTDNHLKGRMAEGTGNLTIRNLSGEIIVKTETQAQSK